MYTVFIKWKIQKKENRFMKSVIKIEGYELLSQKIYRELKMQITRGFIEPGDKLYATKIAKALDVSRTPVREALQKLASEGLLSIAPNRAMVVMEVSIEDAKEVLKIRGALEGLAAGISATRINISELEELEELIQKMKLAIKQNDLIGYCKLDDEFHELIIDICGNKWLVKIRDSLENIIYRFRVKSLSVNGRIEKSFQEHKQIMESLKENDCTKAELLSKKHMDNTIKNIIENVKKDK